MSTRSRLVGESNYFGIFSDGKTFRWRLRQGEPITFLAHPEVVDISLGTWCNGGCPYCYTSATKTGVMYEDVVAKVRSYFGSIPEEHRPFQVAIGGGGEPTYHPEFTGVLEALHKLCIVPNYTTHGLALSQRILSATERWCGGVAVTAHPHLDWQKGVRSLIGSGIETNIHVIVGRPGGSERARAIREMYPDVKSVVLLPYQQTGFATDAVDAEDMLRSVHLMRDGGYALGALFDTTISDNQELFRDIGISVFEHQVYSGYLMLDNEMVMRRSSYDLRERGTGVANC
jgi:hypothetical protein